LSRIAAHIQARKDGVGILRCSVVYLATPLGTHGGKRGGGGLGKRGGGGEVFVVDEIDEV
jgi:hypothetical protein